MHDDGIASAEPKRCVYCLDTRTLRADQVLAKGRFVYLCAPRGQLVEGYLALAPYDCTPSLSRLPSTHLEELAALRAIVAAFYHDVYGVAEPIFYEQGRGGGGASVDEDGNFPLHAHLCGLPLRLDLHEYLRHQYVEVEVASLQDLPNATAGNPYLYLECAGRERYCRCIYVAGSAVERNQLERNRFKPWLARLAGLTGRGDWRTHPGDLELASLIGRFRTWHRDRTGRSLDRRTSR
jgi:hypothetical protein